MGELDGVTGDETGSEAGDELEDSVGSIGSVMVKVVPCSGLEWQTRVPWCLRVMIW